MSVHVVAYGCVGGRLRPARGSVLHGPQDRGQVRQREGGPGGDGDVGAVPPDQAGPPPRQEEGEGDGVGAEHCQTP